MAEIRELTIINATGLKLNFLLSEYGPDHQNHEFFEWHFLPYEQIEYRASRTVPVFRMSSDYGSIVSWTPVIDRGPELGHGTVLLSIRDAVRAAANLTRGGCQFVNGTNESVAVFTIGEDGEEHQIDLAPGDRRLYEGRGAVWLFRSPGGFVEMCLAPSVPDETVTIRQLFAPPLQFPPALGSTVVPILPEAPYQPPNLQDESLIEIAEMPGLAPTLKIMENGATKTVSRFNTLDNPNVRELTISGVKVRFDGSIGRLSALGGKVTDVTKLTIFADHVIIGKKLEWAGADVSIYARRLTFQGKDAQIVTSPQEWLSQAFSARQRNGRPIDNKGDYKNKAEDGQPGENAGSIFLFVKELDLGPGSDKRFVCKGGAGQIGEPGGLKLEENADGSKKKDSELPKHKRGLSLQDIDNAIRNPAYSTGDLPYPNDYWRYPKSGGALRKTCGVK